MKNNNINLFYDKFNLGYLSYSPDGYIWNPNITEISECANKNPLGMDMFMLPITKTRYKFIPPHFSEFLECASRRDIEEKANIEPTDSDFVKLYKLSFLEYYSKHFYIKII